MAKKIDDAQRKVRLAAEEAERRAIVAATTRIMEEGSQASLMGKHVREAVLGDAGSVAKRMATLGSDQEAALDSLAKTEGGRAFEGQVMAEHVGKGPGHGGYMGVVGSPDLAVNDPQIDIKLTRRSLLDRLLGRPGSGLVLQLKSSEGVALKALTSGKYGQTPIMVPKDVFDRLKASGDPRVVEAIKSGKLLSADRWTKAAARAAAKSELNRRYEGREIPGFAESLAGEVGRAATFGGAVRGAGHILGCAIAGRRLRAKELAVVTVGGAVESGARQAIARTTEELLYQGGIVKFMEGGAWLGRSVGAGANFVASTVLDGVSLFRGKISPQEFGVRSGKNAIIGVATVISGPLGIAVSIGFTVHEIGAAYVAKNVAAGNRLLQISSHYAEEERATYGRARETGQLMIEEGQVGLAANLAAIDQLFGVAPLPAAPKPTQKHQTPTQSMTFTR